MYERDMRNPAMDYFEFPPPASHRAIVKTVWTLATAGGPSDRVRHVATPDGCIEIVHRLDGRSFWNGEQPTAFAAGMITAPTELLFSGGASFIGIRLWPWAWNALAAVPAPRLIDRWMGLDEAAPGLIPPASAGDAIALVRPELVEAGARQLAHAILAACNVRQLAGRSGRPVRWLQRWFAREIGVPPRTYLRLLRFQQAFAGLADAEGTLAQHAADHGFTDQAHMAREFRTMAGTPANRVKQRTRAPFL